MILLLVNNCSEQTIFKTDKQTKKRQATEPEPVDHNRLQWLTKALLLEASNGELDCTRCRYQWVPTLNYLWESRVETGVDYGSLVPTPYCVTTTSKVKIKLYFWIHIGSSLLCNDSCCQIIWVLNCSSKFKIFFLLW